MAYNFKKNTCDKCGIDKEEAKKYPIDTGINHPQYRYSTSFHLGLNGSVLCAKCNREEEIRLVFAAMDAADARRKVKEEARRKKMGEYRRTQMIGDFGIL